jgi:predicted GIY-YIG superfamily endonuclease
LATGFFATGMTQNLKQRAYNHNRQRETDGNHHQG